MKNPNQQSSKRTNRRAKAKPTLNPNRPSRSASRPNRFQNRHSTLALEKQIEHGSFRARPDRQFEAQSNPAI
ncbi:hypothetical protein Nepgr_027183 [Nepenthes gracilis]|uniref:Uncharacterized protein n=1 Tax=Nepenthes gracilis TaxID=150966 RepID=A0AAD3T870_NEPGR|nr:hypothetical protein Nepgr_027183 [Nepenthes gracilis]